MDDTQDPQGPLERARAAATAFINGRMEEYAALFPHAPDFTLFPPFGGGPRRGFDDSPQALAETARFFGGGEADVELVAAHVDGDLAVLVVVEREHGVVGGLPDQDWSLRVTMVFRRDGSGWQLLHRHADTLTRPLGLGLVAALARGDALVPAEPPQTPDRAGLDAAEDRLQAAVRANDPDALALVLHDDLVARAPDGQLVGKAEDLAAYAAGTSRIDAYEQLRRAVVLRGGTGVSLVRARVGGTYAGEPLDVTLDYARTWVHEDGRWQVLGAQIDIVA